MCQAISIIWSCIVVPMRFVSAMPKYKHPKKNKDIFFGPFPTAPMLERDQRDLCNTSCNAQVLGPLSVRWDPNIGHPVDPSISHPSHSHTCHILTTLLSAQISICKKLVAAIVTACIGSFRSFSKFIFFLNLALVVSESLGPSSSMNSCRKLSSQTKSPSCKRQAIRMN